MKFDSDFAMTIGGESVFGKSTIAVINPANGKLVGEAPDCTAEQLDQAVVTARAAYRTWRGTAPEQRNAALKQAAAVLLENADPLMRLLTSEQGKPHDEANFEIFAAAHWLMSLAEIDIPTEVNEETVERRSETRHVPLGVAAGLAPWNFPLGLAFWKIAPALKAGNAMIIKPSPFTPLTTLKVGELLMGVFPPGLLNVVSGGDALGPWITSHPGIDKVSFTGSSHTGRLVMASAAQSLKRVTLELGGNDAAIVLPDVDVESVAKDIFWAAFRNSGQVCVAAKRVYVHAEIYDRFSKALVDYARTVRMGDGSEQGILLGPVQNRPQFERVADLIEDSRRHGHCFLLGGDVDRNAAGNFIAPTIVDNPPEESRVVQEEAFGPIVPLLKFDDIDDVIGRANMSEYGLAGSIWATDLEAAARIADKLETGTVWVNEVQYLTPFQAFGGHKQSGIGVENGLGGLLEYTVPQTICVRPPVVQSQVAAVDCLG